VRVLRIVEWFLGIGALALVRCGYVLFLDLWSQDVVSLRRCTEAWCWTLTGRMEWRDLALGSMVEGYGTQCLVNMDNWRLYFGIVFYD
jgi:hypothetical protein